MRWAMLPPARPRTEAIGSCCELLASGRAICSITQGTHPCHPNYNPSLARRNSFALLIARTTTSTTTPHPLVIPIASATLLSPYYSVLYVDKSLLPLSQSLESSRNPPALLAIFHSPDTSHRTVASQSPWQICMNPNCELPCRPNPPILTILSAHSNVDVLVIGAGPTGLGAAKRLNQIVSLAQYFLLLLARGD
jgi:hypothetical protein